ncbi:MAG TPA: RNA-binding S4 domain-containing protein [Aquificae bacterium]|nr:RNA-binding S4 domain-containing protein [Aquificota bacterium]
MRLDKFLKVSRIIKKRDAVKNFCKNGFIKLNGSLAKPSKEVKVGDIIEINTPSKFLKIKVLGFPKSKNVRKQDAKKLYEILEERKNQIQDILKVESEDDFFKEF